MKRMKLIVNFNKNIDFHLKEYCAEGVKDSNFVKIGKNLLRIKQLIRTSLLNQNEVIDLMDKKFREYSGVKFVTKTKKSYKNGEIIYKNYEKIIFLKKTPPIIKSILENIFFEVSRKDFEEFQKYLIEKIKVEEFPELLYEVVSEQCLNKIQKDTRQAIKDTQSLKTSNYGFYQEPPMGNNQFLKGIVDKEIFSETR